MTYTVHNYTLAYTVSLSKKVTTINKICGVFKSTVSINFPFYENLECKKGKTTSLYFYETTLELRIIPPCIFSNCYFLSHC